MNQSATYVAFLRGINVGGNKPVKMDALREAFGSLGFDRVRTVQNSGNVVFEAQRSDPALLAKRIGKGLEEVLGFNASVIVRSERQIEDLIDSQPFADVEAGPQTRLLVSFLPGPPPGGFKAPSESPSGDYAILSATSGEVFSVLELSSGFGTPDLMKILEKELGPQITTRSWKTILKIREKLL